MLDTFVFFLKYVWIRWCPWLTPLVRLGSWAVNQPAHMSYEELIIMNCRLRWGPMVFNRGLMGRWERIFYLVHFRIEKEFERIFECIKEGQEQQLRQCFGRVLMHLKVFERMPPEAFQAFKPFFRPRNGVKGPSGVFSETIPLLQLRVLGCGPAEYAVYLRENLRYFPRQSRAKIEEAISEGPRQTDPLIAKAVRDFLLQFRGIHYRLVVGRHMPELANPDEKGAAGEGAGFLRDRIKHTPKS